VAWESDSRKRDCGINRPRKEETWKSSPPPKPGGNTNYLPEAPRVLACGQKRGGRETAHNLKPGGQKLQGVGFVILPPKTRMNGKLEVNSLRRLGLGVEVIKTKKLQAGRP